VQKESFAWALLLDRNGYLDAVKEDARRHLTDEDLERFLRGVSYAQDIAREARRRRAAQLLTQYERDGLAPEDRGLRPLELARVRGVSLEHMYAEARKARGALFGKAADRTIRHRLARWALRNSRASRYCEVAGCMNELPRRSRTTRRRCDACRAAGRRTRAA
jgi:hypothetical protein